MWQARAEKAEQERDELIRAVADHVTVRGEYYERMTKAESALSESLAHGARLVEALTEAIDYFKARNIGQTAADLLVRLTAARSQTPAQVKEWFEGERRRISAEALEAYARGLRAGNFGLRVVADIANAMDEQARSIRKGSKQ